VSIGEPHQTAARYLELNFARELERRGGTAGQRAGDGSARVVEMWVEDREGQHTGLVLQGDRCVFRARVRFHETVEDPSFAVSWVNELQQNHFVVNTAVEQERTGRFQAGEEVMFSVAFDNVLAPGRYDLSMLLAHRGGGTDIIDRWEREVSVVVAASTSAGGLVDLPHELRLERLDRGGPTPAAEMLS
jgi:hypothetical protein